jgi:hypothetical protein
MESPFDMEDDFQRVQTPSVVRMAEEVLAIYDENQYLRRRVKELEHYQTEYIELLNSSIAHSQQMMGSMLKAALDPESVVIKGWKAIEQERAAKTIPG